MTRRDDALERVVLAAQAVRDEDKATTPDGGLALARLREAVREADRVEQPGESARDVRLRDAALAADLSDPDLVGQLLAALDGPAAPIEWSGLAGPIELPQTIIGRGAGCVLPVGEVAILAGAGGGGKSRLTLQIALAAAGANDGWPVRPFERAGSLRPGSGRDAIVVTGGPVVMLGYEDRIAWVRDRLRQMGEWSGVGNVDPARLGFACVDRPLFSVPADGRRDALPVATSTYSALWDRVGEVGARLVIIDPAALALECVGYDAAPVGRFMAALRRDALAHGAGVGLVAHSSKAARRKEADDDDPGVVAGAAAWWDRARAVLVLKRDGSGWRLRLAKSNYAKSDEPGAGLQLAAVEDRGHLVAFEVDAGAPAPGLGASDGNGAPVGEGVDVTQAGNPCRL